MAGRKDANLASAVVTRLRQRLIRELHKDEPTINLAKGALLIAAEEYPGLDINATLHELDKMALEIADRVAKEGDPHTIVDILNWYLFEVQGFEGNRDDYYDPRNSFLNDVLVRHTGIPLTLSIVYVEVARRVGFNVDGVGFPGHFLVKHETAEGDILIDPYNKGDLLDEDDCQTRLKSMFGDGAEFEPGMIEAVSKRSMLVRMLVNLKEIYLKSKDYPRALSHVERTLLLAPDEPDELRDRGMISYQLECYSAALADLSRYLELAPQASDANQIKETMRMLRQLEPRLN